MTRDDITLPRDDDEEFTRERVTTLLLEVMDWTYAKAHRERPMTCWELGRVARATM